MCDAETIRTAYPNCDICIHKKKPSLAVDIYLEMHDQLLLVKRLNPPFGWALPGGFVDNGETVEEAAIRELKEETGLVATKVEQIKVVSDPDRDPRGHVITVLMRVVDWAYDKPMGMDDAEEAKFFDLDDLPELVFDHAELIKAAYVPPKYNHAVDIAFEVVNDNPDGECTTEELLMGMARRLVNLAQCGNEVQEAAGAYDTYEVEK